MNILGQIMDKIFPARTAAAPPKPGAATASPATPTPQAASPTPQNVDVNALLTKMAQDRHENLNWKTSIVDLMKLLGLDSSLANRKQLAQELKYPGDMNNSAEMNVWLQKQVMQKLSESGGKVPPELLH